MPVLTRADGKQFAVYTYRETLSSKSTAILRREAMMLARENGQYARFFAIETGEVEAIFSRDPGYLLAETVWQHFGNPVDMVYCETLAGTDNALLVVIRGGNVYLDAELPVINLADELISLAVGDNRYEIYVHGDVPLAAVATDEKFAFEPIMVESFTELADPVFPTLELDESFKLLPIDDALAELRLPSTGIAKNLVIFIFISIIGYIGWKILMPAKVVAPIVQQPIEAQVVTPQNPYAAYQAQLESPAPAAILLDIVNDIELLMTIPGWSSTSMTWADQKMTFTLQQNGGDAGLLLAWVKNHQVNFLVNGGHAELAFAMMTPNRATPTTIYNLRETVAQLYDDLSRIFPEHNSVAVGAMETKDNYKQVTLNITFSDVTLSVFTLLARELQNFPVILTNCTLTIDSGILSGTMQLEVLGA